MYAITHTHFLAKLRYTYVYIDKLGNKLYFEML